MAAIVCCTITPIIADPIGYSISPRGKIKDSERVVGLTITVTNGTFRSFEGIPAGWYFRLDNSTHQDQALVGEVSVGAGALYSKDLPQTWICVQPTDQPGTSFAISGRLEVTSDFVKTRKVKLTKADFVSRPCSPPAKRKSGR